MRYKSVAEVSGGRRERELPWIAPSSAVDLLGSADTQRPRHLPSQEDGIAHLAPAPPVLAFQFVQSRYLRRRNFGSSSASSRFRQFSTLSFARFRLPPGKVHRPSLRRRTSSTTPFFLVVTSLDDFMVSWLWHL
jgi:hypothetical protein